jgi:hypothetical protein
MEHAFVLGFAAGFIFACAMLAAIVVYSGAADRALDRALGHQPHPLDVRSHVCEKGATCT